MLENKKSAPSLCEKVQSSNRERITSIDALRAIVLWGILLVHVKYGFNFPGIPRDTYLGNIISTSIEFFLNGRCGGIFSLLFGVSFYLILRNPSYSSRKFVWRCFLLFVIGLFNKIFYSADALMWYGLWGMVLVIFRKFSAKQLFLLFIIIYTLNFVLSYLVEWNVLLKGIYDVEFTKYSDAPSLIEVVTYPLWKTAISYAFSVSLFGTLSRFILGYCIAKSGVIENLKQYVNIKYFLFFSIPYISLWIIGVKTNLLFLKDIGFLLGSFCYAELFLLLYYKFYPKLRFFEPYGKMALTNYSLQGLFGVVFASLIIVPYGLSFELFFFSVLLFFCFQIIFSIKWIKTHKYGPMEWLWRCVTSLNFTSNKKIMEN